MNETHKNNDKTKVMTKKDYSERFKTTDQCIDYALEMEKENKIHDAYCGQDIGDL